MDEIAWLECVNGNTTLWGCRAENARQLVTIDAGTTTEVDVDLSRRPQPIDQLL